MGQNVILSAKEHGVKEPVEFSIRLCVSKKMEQANKRRQYFFRRTRIAQMKDMLLQKLP